MKEHKADIIVVGSGLAGYAAALAAAEHARVIVVERYAFPGGAATQTNVGTLCGLYYREKEPVAVPHHFCAWFMRELFQADTQAQTLSLAGGLHVVSYEWSSLQALLKQHLNHKNIKFLNHVEISHVHAGRNTITSITASQGTDTFTLRGRAFIDCSGNGYLSQALGTNMIQSASYQAAAQVIRLEHVRHTTEYALNIALRKAMIDTHNLEAWPTPYLKVSVIPGSLRDSQVDLKLPLHETVTDDPALPERLRLEVETNLARLTTTFRRVESLSDTTVETIFGTPGIRLQQRPEGQYILSHTDVARCAHPQDGIALGTWPIEEWDQDGKVNLEYFTEGDGYLIPARSLRSPIFENLYFAGKAISADNKAIASARVTGTCLQTGYAAGKLATASNTQEQEKIIHGLRATLIHKP